MSCLSLPPSLTPSHTHKLKVIQYTCPYIYFIHKGYTCTCSTSTQKAGHTTLCILLMFKGYTVHVRTCTRKYGNYLGSWSSCRGTRKGVSTHTHTHTGGLNDVYDYVKARFMDRFDEWRSTDILQSKQNDRTLITTTCMYMYMYM